MTIRPYRNERLVCLLCLLTAGTVASGCSSSPSGAPAQAGGMDASPQDDGSVDASSPTDTDATTSPDALVVDGSIDTGKDSGAVPEAAPAPTCGPPPNRFTILTGADAGLVRDNVTALVWMNNSVGGGEPPQTQAAAATNCSGRGMRLPTKDEAVALASSYAPCAFGQWSTWTSTAAGIGDAWVVDYLGGASPQLANNFPSAVLCVREPAG